MFASYTLFTVADDLTTTASIFRGSRITERLAAKIRDFPFQVKTNVLFLLE